MNCNEKARERVERIFGLPVREGDQDWPIEVANGGRVVEFVTKFRVSTLSIDERYAAMALILASYDELIQEEGSDTIGLWQEIVAFLNHGQYDDLLTYWAAWDDAKDSAFSITPQVREYLGQRQLLCPR